ncbi:MAG: thioredoxin TrxC [Gammaproteobacteria bacterium]|jgi:thioredoxin 2
MDVLNVVCSNCNSVNRVPAAKLGSGGKCGKCHARLFAGKPIALDEENFARHIERSDIPVLVDFWAAWCGPCQVMAPVFEQAARELEPNVRLAKVNTEAAQGLALKFGIRSIPSLLVFKGGREVARIAGALGLSDLLQWTRQHAFFNSG